MMCGLTECPLRLCYPKIYSICENKKISVAEAYDRGWEFDFRRGFSENDMLERRELIDLLL